MNLSKISQKKSPKKIASGEKRPIFFFNRQPAHLLFFGALSRFFGKMVQLRNIAPSTCIPVQQPLESGHKVSMKYAEVSAVNVKLYFCFRHHPDYHFYTIIILEKLLVAVELPQLPLLLLLNENART